MNIQKRDGSWETYQVNKIAQAISSAFKACNTTIDPNHLHMICDYISANVKESAHSISVEEIQDMVEEQLMKMQYFKEAKAYILYREERKHFREIRKKWEACLLDSSLLSLFECIQQDFSDNAYSLQTLYAKYQSFHKDNMDENAQLDAIIKACVELISVEAPKWEYIAARFLRHKIHKTVTQEMEKHKITNYSEKLRFLEEEGYYGAYIREHYTNAQIETLFHYTKPKRDQLFTYSGLDLLAKRYLLTSHQHTLLETPQEMFMGIAMHLAMVETDSLYWAKQFYDMLSTLKVTMGTPTLSNARKPFHQLSSCFIDTVNDSLHGIYKSLDNFAQVSKFGGGMGMYFGKVRAAGSAIRGYQGAAGGIIRWIRLVNDTAVAVDQLGVRAGAAAVYLDAWHKDLPEFLNLRTNNGDDRAKAHDIFPAVCYPNLFWKMVEENMDQTWYLLCPHDVYTIKGYHLEDYYGDEWEKRYWECVHDARISKREIILKELIRLILKSAVETGTPFAFNRDHVNHANPNKHKGMIYCSNLCTEIAQNMSAMQHIEQKTILVDGEEVIIDAHQSGDFVVCNLASLVLGNINVTDDTELRHIIHTAVRALDNVISLNYYPLPYARITSQKYRAIGLGTSGYHHMLVKQGMTFESDEHLQYIDALYEKINYYAIEASCALAKEKGAYTYYPSSEWENGNYFTTRGYNSKTWKALKRDVKQYGMRNGYLLATAPTSSTSILAGTSASVDPIMNKFFLEEKKGSIITRIAPDLSKETFWLYKSAHTIDQNWVVKAAGIRQRHIDQAQSLNLYITNEFTMRQVLHLYLEAYRLGVKTIYYVRSKSLEVEECESCAA